MTEEDSAPDPPLGYRPYEPYFGDDVDRGVASGYALILVGLFALTALAWFRVEQDEVVEAVVIMVGMVVVLLFTHELAHAAVGWVIGAQVTMSFVEFSDDSRRSRVSPVVHAYDVFCTRWESGLFYAAPLLVITPICVVVVLLSSDVKLVFAALVALLVNTGGAAKDLRGIWETIQLPRDVLEYHCSDGRYYYYVPGPD